MAGSNDVSGFGEGPASLEPFNAHEHQNSMESLFEQNFLKNAKEEESKATTGKYQIDLLDGNDEEQEDLDIKNDDDPDEREVKKNMKNNQF